MSKLPLSIIVHTRNSSRTLERALKSVQSFAQQIIVMDMESSDDSIEIAKKFTTEIFTTPDVGYSEPARNAAIKKVTQPWLFFLDADEWLESEVKEKMRELVSVSDGSVSAYAFPRQNHIFGLVANVGWWPDYQTRMFRKGFVVWNSKIHSKPKIEGKTEILPDEIKYAIQHDNYASVFDFLDRLNRYTSIEISADVKTESPLKAFIDEFVRRYALSDGYKEGDYGQSLSLLQGMYESVKAIKSIEKKGFSKKASSNVEDLRYMADVASYWVRSIELERERNPFKRLLIRIKRKLQL